MKRNLLLALTLFTISYTLKAQQTFNITNSGFQFVPSVLTITVGDTVEFLQSASHPAMEVSLSTWNANGNTALGGGFLGTNGDKIKFNTAGTYYYVCQNHFASGMKGQIVVQPANTIQEEVEANVLIKAFPSPVISDLNLSLELTQSEELSIEVYNVIGEQVYSQAETTFATGKNTLAIDFSDFSNGAYFVKVIGKNDQYSIKVLK